MGTTNSHEGGSSYSPTSNSAATWKPKPIDTVSQLSYTSHRRAAYSPQTQKNAHGRITAIRYIAPGLPTVIRYISTNGTNNSKVGSVYNASVVSYGSTIVTNPRGPPSTIVVAPSQADDMPSLKRKKSHRVLVERKVRFLGRFYTQAMTDTTLNKLRSHVRLTNGTKTKLKLSHDGLSSGSKYATLFKGKLSYEFTPLRDIADIVMDDQYPNLLMVINRLPDGNYEIMAYKVNINTEGRLFQNTFADLVLKQDREEPTMEYPIQVSIMNDNTDGNWTLRGNNKWERKPVAAVYPRENGIVPNGMSLNDVMYKKVSKSQDFATWKNNRSSGPDKRHHGSARDLLDSRDQRDFDRMSNGSDVSVETMKNEIATLSREVHHLKTMMSDNKSPDRMSQKEFNDADSVVSTASRPGQLVDKQAGLVKARVRDYRHPSAVPMSGNPPSPGGQIRVVYRRDGENIDAGNNTLNNQRNGRAYSRSARHEIESNRDMGPIYATVQKKRSHSPGAAVVTTRGRTYSAPDYVYPAPPSPTHVIRSRSIESPNRFRLIHSYDTDSTMSVPARYSNYSSRPLVERQRIHSQYPTSAYHNAYSTVGRPTHRSTSSYRNDRKW